MGRQGIWKGLDPKQKQNEDLAPRERGRQIGKGCLFVFVTCSARHCSTCDLCHLTLRTLLHSPDKETEAQTGKVIDLRLNHKGISNGRQIQGHSCLAPKGRQGREVRCLNARLTMKEMSCGTWSLPHTESILLCASAQGHC